MRRSIALAIVVAIGFLVSFISLGPVATRSPASSRVIAPATTLIPPRPKHSVHRPGFQMPGEAPVVTTPSGPPPSLPAVPQVMHWNGPRPTRLADADISPAVAERLKSLHPMDRELIDFKLRLLPGLQSCLDGKVNSSGDVTLFFHFDVSKDHATAIGSGVDVRESGLDEADDTAFSECASIALKAAGDLNVQSENVGDEPQYHWSTTIHVPPNDDLVYPSIAGKLRPPPS